MNNNNSNIKYSMLDKTVISIFASSKAKPLFILGGTLLKGIGHIIHREDVIYLGHYLQGSGKHRILSQKFRQQIVDTVMNSEPIGDGVLYTIEENELFTTIGKAHCEVNGCEESGIVKVWDKYVFYPTCHHPSTHFDDCNCDPATKSYAELVRTFRFFKKLKIRKSSYRTVRIDPESTITLRTGISGGGFQVHMCIKDSFWVGKGKEFTTSGTFEW